MILIIKLHIITTWAYYATIDSNEMRFDYSYFTL